MLRRVARLLRAGLFGMGVVCLAWWPWSCFYVALVEIPFPFEGATVNSHHGILYLGAHRDRPDRDPLTFQLRHRLLKPYQRGVLRHALPHVASVNSNGYIQTGIFIPLWLLAFLCLAWPVTSFILDRRRRARGFAFEP